MGMETLVLMDKIKAWNLPIKSHMSALSDDQIEEIRIGFQVAQRQTQKEKVPQKEKGR